MAILKHRGRLHGGGLPLFALQHLAEFYFFRVGPFNGKKPDAGCPERKKLNFFIQQLAAHFLCGDERRLDVRDIKR